MSSDEYELHNFHGCYLLCNDFKRTYIGYTVNPLRRVEQHNLGREKGGAKKTENRGPWVMVLIVYGFMSNVAALQFEWAWQHPQLSKKLKSVVASLDKSGKRKETLAFRVRVMATMLGTPPWKFLPLTVRWVTPSFKVNLHVQTDVQLPKHVRFREGPFEDKAQFRISSSSRKKTEEMLRTFKLGCCIFCGESLEHETEDFALCPNYDKCQIQSHLICWADESISRFHSDKDILIPSFCYCPNCHTELIWADVVCFKQKFQPYVVKSQQVERKMEMRSCDDKSAHNESLGQLLKLLDG